MRTRSAIKTLREITVLKTIAKKRMAEFKENRANQNKKLADHEATVSSTYRTYNKKEAINWLEIEHANTFDRAFKSIKTKFPEKKFDRELNKNYSFSLEDLHFFADEMGVKAFKRSKGQECIAIAIANLKGGVGKTTTCVNVGAGLSVSNNKRYRILVIDCDPQGTSTLFGVPNLSDDAFTVGDILQSAYELEEDETEEKFILSCIQDTNIPNLKYMPAKVTDFFFESYAEKMQIEDTLVNKEDIYKVLKTKVVDIVKEHFDIILIDTPPSLNKTFYNSMYAADAVITTLKPEMLSFDATMKYLERFDDIYRIIANAGHPGFYFNRMLITDLDNTRSSSKTNVGHEYFSMMKKYFQDRVIPVPIMHSKAIQYCATFFTTIYGMKPSEYDGPRNNLLDAQRNMDDVVGEVEHLCSMSWEPNEFEGL
jgi:chromosome partitioning protein